MQKCELDGRLETFNFTEHLSFIHHSHSYTARGTCEFRLQQLEPCAKGCIIVTTALLSSSIHIIEER